MSTVVAIDGPAGAGKSTVARLVAEKMGYAYINTGSLYRAVAYAGLAAGKELEKLDRGFLETLKIVFRGADLYLNGRKLEAELRTPQCATGASIVAVQPMVREYLLEIQRRAADAGWIVMEGRDIGTVIFPDAEKKYFVTATAEERARRRLAQSGENEKGAKFEDILAEIKRRDERDSTRETAPLKPAADAVILDTTGLTIAEVVERIASDLSFRV